MRYVTVGGVVILLCGFVVSAACAAQEEPVVAEPVVTDARTSPAIPSEYSGPCPRAEIAMDLALDTEQISVADCVDGEWAVIHNSAGDSPEELVLRRVEAQWTRHAETPSEVCAEVAAESGVPEAMYGYFADCAASSS